MEGIVRHIHFLVIVTALIGGAVSVFAAIGNTKSFLSCRHVSVCYKVSYVFMGISMALFAVRGLIGPE